MTAACILVGAVMPAARWAIGGGITHVVHPRGSRHRADGSHPSAVNAGLPQCQVVKSPYASTRPYNLPLWHPNPAFSPDAY